jgi:8-oxo-dGTP diphosphatase
MRSVQGARVATDVVGSVLLSGRDQFMALEVVVPAETCREVGARRLNALEPPSMISMRNGDSGERPELPVVATIPASAGALVRGREGRLLILKPTYKGGWTIPGGVIEVGESPWEACRRETQEECGLEVTAGRLVCVDFLHPRPGRAGGMRFLFDCGVFDDAVLDTVVIQPAEIAESRVLPLETALPLLSGPVRRRVRAACESNQVRYLEDGREVEGVSPR